MVAPAPGPQAALQPPAPLQAPNGQAAQQQGHFAALARLAAVRERITAGKRKLAEADAELQARRLAKRAWLAGAGWLAWGGAPAGVNGPPSAGLPAPAAPYLLISAAASHHCMPARSAGAGQAHPVAAPGRGRGRGGGEGAGGGAGRAARRGWAAVPAGCAAAPGGMLGAAALAGLVLPATCSWLASRSSLAGR